MKKLRKEHKKNYDMVNNTDTVWDRSNANRAGTIQGKEKKSLGGKEIMKILGIEPEQYKSPADKDPLKMMDVVLQFWNEEEPSEESEGEEEEEDE